jgi:hypothetical protein
MLGMEVVVQFIVGSKEQFMRYLPVVIVILAFILAPVLSGAADFSAYSELDVADSFLNSLFERFETKQVSFNVSKPFELGVLKRFPVEIGFLMCEPERTPDLIEELESFFESDTSLRVSSMAIFSSADFRQDGKIVVKVVMYASIFCSPAADEAKKFFPNAELKEILRRAKFEPGVKFQQSNDEIDIWLTNLRIISENNSKWAFEFAGYAKDDEALRTATDAIFSASGISDFVFPTTSQTTYSKLPFLKFDGLASFIK